MRNVHRAFIAASTLLLLAWGTQPAAAGCGCDKPPPALADLRPSATWAGMPVTIFSDRLASGATYDVTFTSGISDEHVTVTAAAQARRDLADGGVKPQLVVPLPALALGPVAVTVLDPASGQPLLALDDGALTQLAAPVAVPDQTGTWTIADFRAAVGRDGVTYVALDLAGLTRPLIFDAQAEGYPLRFGGEDVIFYNAQGFVMQLLVKSDEPVPGMFVVPAPDPTRDSDILRYSRHEFVTYFLQHMERQVHAVDASDPQWHTDGTPCIDHDHLVLAIAGTLADGGMPAPGATPPFTLAMTARSLFHNGLVGDASLTVEQSATTDSYDPTDGSYGVDGDVYSNGPITVSGSAVVGGDATGATITVRQRASVLGDTFLVSRPISFMDVVVPKAIPDLGNVVLTGDQGMTIHGPGSFRLGDLLLYGTNRIYVDNLEGPVTLYVTGAFEMWDTAEIVSADGDPERLAIYLASNKKVRINGSDRLRFEGVVYAPYSDMEVRSGDFFGALVARNLRSTWNARIHYPTTLRSAVSTGIAPVDLTTTKSGGDTTTSALDMSGSSAASTTTGSPTTAKTTGQGATR